MERARLILRQESDCIYRVWTGEKRIGTLLEERHGKAHYWTWSIAGVHSDPPGAVTSFGRSDTQQEAMAALRGTFDAILAGPHHWTPKPAEWIPGSGKWLG